MTLLDDTFFKGIKENFKDTFGTPMPKANHMNGKLIAGLRTAIHEADPNLSQVELAVAVAHIIKTDYGTHNITPFLNRLKYELNK